MRLAVTLVVALALVPQVLFSVLYWRWIPQWVKNPYGRLSQLGSWCHIVLLILYLLFLLFGRSFDKWVSGVLLILAFSQLVIFGILQLLLLRKAVSDSEKEDLVHPHDN